MVEPTAAEPTAAEPTEAEATAAESAVNEPTVAEQAMAEPIKESEMLYGEIAYERMESDGRMGASYEKDLEEVDSTNLIYYESLYIYERERELNREMDWEAFSKPIYGKVAFGVTLRDCNHLLERLMKRIDSITGSDECIRFRGETPYIIIRRQDVSMKDAILQCIEEICKVDLGFSEFPVSCIEPGDEVNQAEIARRLKRSNESIRLYYINARGGGGFPEPLSGRSNRPLVWSWAEVVSWASDRIIFSHPRIVENAIDIKSINMALYLRRDTGKRVREILKPAYQELREFDNLHGEEVNPTAKYL